MTLEDDESAPAPEPGSAALRDDGFPDGTTEEDRVCWVCGGPTEYRHCKIICKNCGFTRDCSDL